MGSHLLSANHLGEAAAMPSTTDIKQYQAIVGSLMYAMLYTRSDLVYAVQQLLQFNSNPVNTHFKRQNESFDTFRALKRWALSMVAGNTMQTTRFKDIAIQIMQRTVIENQFPDMFSPS